MERIVVDTDPGIDDALALLYLDAHPDAEIVAVGTVHGNVTATQGAANALQLLNLMGLEHVPVAVGAQRPLAQPLSIAEFVHGADGFGGKARPVDGVRPVSVSAAEQLVCLARARPGELTLLALGPLTNIALALLLEPELPSMLRRVVIMGGALNTAGNITSHAEANFFHDPEAADLVLEAGFDDLTLVGLDVTEAARADAEWLDTVAALPDERAQFAADLLEHYVSFYESMLGRRTCTLHDPLAAAITLDPTLAAYREVRLRVELRGSHTRGQLIADLRDIASTVGPTRGLVKVAVSANSSTLLQDLLSALKTPTP